VKKDLSLDRVILNVVINSGIVDQDHHVIGNAEISIISSTPSTEGF